MKKNGSGPFELFSFEEQLENDDINIPKHCMKNHPKFNDITMVTIDLDELADSDVDTDADARKSDISSLSENGDSTKKKKNEESKESRVFTRPKGRNAARAAEIQVNNNDSNKGNNFLFYFNCFALSTKPHSSGKDNNHNNHNNHFFMQLERNFGTD